MSDSSILSLAPIFLFSGESSGGEFVIESADFGVNVQAYGLGQLTGAIFSVPPGGEIGVDFKLRLQCVTGDAIKNMENLIKSLLDASKREKYEEDSKLTASGGFGFSFFWSGGARASYEQTKRRMEEYGLSEENQRTIVNQMMQLANSLQEFNYRGTVRNTFDFTVSGSLFGFIMDCQITTGQETNEVRVIGPKPVLRGADGAAIPVLEPLF
jgi:hypothetical protein